MSEKVEKSGGLKIFEKCEMLFIALVVNWIGAAFEHGIASSQGLIAMTGKGEKKLFAMLRRGKVGFASLLQVVLF